LPAVDEGLVVCEEEDVLVDKLGGAAKEKKEECDGHMGGGFATVGVVV
jgi:hypothetical protein